MSKQRGTWQQAIRELGLSFLEVAQAELAVLTEEWRNSGKVAGKAGLFFGLAAFALFWIPPLVMFAVVLLLDQWIGPLWLAALATAGLGLLVVALLGLVGSVYWRRLESPTASTKRRVNEHLLWWQDQVLQTRPRVAGEEGSEQDDESGPRGPGEEPAAS